MYIVSTRITTYIYITYTHIYALHTYTYMIYTFNTHVYTYIEVGTCVSVCVCVIYVYIYTEYGKGHVAEKFPRRVKLLLICCGLSHSVFLPISLSLTHIHTHTHTHFLSLRLSTFLSVPLHARVPEYLAFSYTHWRSFYYYSTPSSPNSRDSRRPFTNHRYTHTPNPIARLYVYVYIHPELFRAESSTALASFHFQD